MSTQYISELINSTLRVSYPSQVITPGSHYAFISGNNISGSPISGVNNSGNLDLFWDMEIYWKFTTAPTGGFNVYIISAPSGAPPFVSYGSVTGTSGWFEDGIPLVNSGTTAASPAPDSHNLVDYVAATDSGFHRVVLQDIAVPPYMLVPIINNADTATNTGTFGINIYGKNLQTIGP